MRKIALKLKYDCGTYNRKNETLLCRAVLSELFTLPKDRSTKITLTISDNETSNSYKVKFGENTNCQVYYDNKWNSITLLSDADAFIRNKGLSGKTAWVTLYWEE